MILSAAQLAATGRDDRPGRLNNIVLQFQISDTPTSTKVLTVRAPTGFLFQENCLPGLVTNSSLVFGSPSLFNANQYAKWDPTKIAQPILCNGRGSTMQLTLMPGVQKGSSYVMRVQVFNPAQTPAVRRRGR